MMRTSFVNDHSVVIGGEKMKCEAFDGRQI